MSNFITEIKIGKVRHLENIDITLGNEKKHLILTGKNGSGKTSVLENLNELLVYNYLINYEMNPNDMVKNGLSFSFYENFYNYMERIQGNFVYSFFKSKRNSDFIEPEGIHKIYFDEVKPSEKLNMSFLQYIVNLKAERSFARDDNDIKSIKAIDTWFEKFENMLRQIFNDDSLFLTFDRKQYNFIINRQNREPFDFNGLSDGYSAIIDIITEILLKVEATESHNFNCEGIVLIDEIETHLHVELQKNILPLLTNFFPNIQFIVTTHSPFVLSSIENSVVYDLETHICTENLSEASYTGLIRKYFELPSEYSTVLENKFKEFKTLAKKETMTEVEEDRLIELDVEFKNISPLFSPEIYSSYLDIRKEFLQ